MAEERTKRILYWDKNELDWEEVPYHEIVRGIEVDGVASILQAEEKLREKNFDLVAVHHNSNRTYEFARDVRQKYPDMLILSVTGSISNRKDDREKYMMGVSEDFPFDDIVPKKYFDMETTIDRIVTILEEVNVEINMVQTRK